MSQNGSAWTGRGNRLGRRLAIYILLFSAVITTILTALQIRTDYTKDVSAVEDNLMQIEVGMVGSIAESLWNFDAAALKVQLNDMLNISDIVHVALHAPNQEALIFSTKTASSHNIEKTFTLKHDNLGKMEEIGTLTVRASLDEVRKRTWERVWIILGGQALKTYLVSTFILFLFHRMVSSHLFAIAEFARQCQNFAFRPPLALRRKPNAFRDELDDVVVALNAMQDTNYSLYYRLRSQNEKLQSILDNTNAIVFVKDLDGRYILVNRQFEQVFGMPAQNVIGKTDHDILPAEVAAAFHAHDQKTLEAGTPYEAEESHTHANGIHTYLSLRFPLIEPAGRVYGVCSILNDITQRIQIEAALFGEKERAQVTLDAIGDAVITTDMQGGIQYLNPAAEKLTGWTRADATGVPCPQVLQLLDGARHAPAIAPSRQVLKAEKAIALSGFSILVSRTGEERAVESNGAPIRDRARNIIGTVLVFRDVSATYQMASRLLHQATHDLLTGLPNRRLLLDRFNHAATNARRSGQSIAMLFLDLDRFKNVNDSLGHSTGDMLLQQVAERLQACARASDTVSRQGGDEFIILAEAVSDPEDVIRIAEKILLTLNEPYFICGHEMTVTPSIGISIYPADGQSFDDIVKNADTAMYRAKAVGRNRYQFFTPDMNTRALERLSLENALRQALARQEFLLYYQPKVSPASGKLEGAEVLLRWRHPEQGMISPAKFIPVAEDSGIMTVLGHWVLKQACLQACAWMNAGLNPGLLAVNLSAAQFRQSELVTQIGAILRDTGMEPHLLELELTESMIMESGQHLTMLSSLKELGVSLAIDDFGTGYSSLSYLRRFPVDTLKIDQAFVRHIANNADDAAIVDAIIGLGHSLHLKVVAEGVEDQAQMEFLREHACDMIQGFYYSQPLSAEEFEMLLMRNCHPAAEVSYLKRNRSHPSTPERTPGGVLFH
jgi:diguanylate cyclase (GGDEF)-like protein/PAS domain S-box-containing protein